MNARNFLKRDLLITYDCLELLYPYGTYTVVVTDGEACISCNDDSELILNPDGTVASFTSIHYEEDASIPNYELI
jgi:hypothetical protein